MIYLFIYLTFNLSQKGLYCQRSDTDSGKLIKHQLYLRTKHYFCTGKSIDNVDKCAFHNIDCTVKHASYPQLISLDLRSNKIEHINEFTFDTLINMTRLYLSNNKIKYLPVNLLIKNKKLVIFSISKNQLSTLPKHIFKYNRELQTIFLGYNKLTNFIIESAHLQKLKLLTLHGNELTSLDRDTFGAFLVEHYVGKLRITVDFASFTNTCYCDNIWIESKIDIINAIIKNRKHNLTFCDYINQGNNCNENKIITTG